LIQSISLVTQQISYWIIFQKKVQFFLQVTNKISIQNGGDQKENASYEA